MNRLIPLLLLTLLAAGCGPAIQLTDAGPVEVGKLRFDAPHGLNRLDRQLVPFTRPGTQVWTQDGLPIDRLIVIPAVPEGEPLFREANREMALPRFRADMLPNELLQFTESSLVKIYGEGDTIVTTSGLRPARFGDDRGIMFDLRVVPGDGPSLGGLAGAFIVDDELHMLLFVAAEPHYYRKHRLAAESMIQSARLK